MELEEVLYKNRWLFSKFIHSFKEVKQGVNMEAKTLIILIIFVASTASSAIDTIDYSRVIPRTEIPGFWDGRLIAPILLEKSFHDTFNRNGRIVGGNEAAPNSHPYQAGILMVFTWWTGMCGGCLISDKHVLTAAHW